MTRRGVLGLTLVLVLLAAVIGWLVLRPSAPTTAHAGHAARADGASVVAKETAAPTAPAARTPLLARLAAEIPADAISPIAAGLNAPEGTAQQDLAILESVLEAWQTNFPRDGNPVGSNDEITAALAGQNPLRFAFIAPTHPAINAAGELCDRWGTPVRFHALAATTMELASAGPDRRFGTEDDVRQINAERRTSNAER